MAIPPICISLRLVARHATPGDLASGPRHAFYDLRGVKYYYNFETQADCKAARRQSWPFESQQEHLMVVLEILNMSQRAKPRTIHIQLVWEYASRIFGSTRQESMRRPQDDLVIQEAGVQRAAKAYTAARHQRTAFFKGNGFSVCRGLPQKLCDCTCGRDEKQEIWNY